jgi:hypothetical protein
MLGGHVCGNLEDPESTKVPSPNRHLKRANTFNRILHGKVRNQGQGRERGRFRLREQGRGRFSYLIIPPPKSEVGEEEENMSEEVRPQETRAREKGVLLKVKNFIQHLSTDDPEVRRNLPSRPTVPSPVRV